MKKYLFLAAALTVMGCGMSSCSNNAEDVIEQNEQAPEVTKLVFTVAQGAETRATWGGTNGRTPMFEEGEKVSLFSEYNDNVELTAHVSGGTVTLEGTGVADTDLYFVHPYCATAHMADGKITSTEDAEPYYIEYDIYKLNLSTIGVDTYPANALSLAKSTDGGASAISFKGLMAILKFTPLETRTGYICIVNIGIKKVGGYSIPKGKITIDAAQEKITTEGNNGAYIQIPRAYDDDETGYSFESGKSYYIAIPPCTVENNAEIRICPWEIPSRIDLWSGPKTFEAGKIYSKSW